jgi:Protein of unknown function (DUF3604)
MNPTGMLAVVPSRLGVGETFSIKVKLRGPVREIPCANGFCTVKPRLGGPFNLNVERRIQYMDDCLPQWTGHLDVDCESLDSPRQLRFDGRSQGVFPGDTRPIKVFAGFRFTTPGFHFIRLVDPASGSEGWTNPVWVSPAAPRERIWWGDPHWQTYFSDGVRCPEELYAFARDEAFLDFGAISDHMEAVTDRQWDYFQAVTNDFNSPGRFATLHGQEWTHHLAEGGAPGHRNIYFRGNGGPALRATDPDCNTLEKLWARLDALSDTEALAVPHHSASVAMGVDWQQGWNPRYEKAVEIYSVWGNSEKPGSSGNPRPIRASGGETDGRHVVDALKRGYRFGFIGGGDIHDGRPGDDLHTCQENVAGYAENLYPQGFTAAIASALSREATFDAMATRQTYATTGRRIYLDVSGDGDRLTVQAAAEDGLREVVLVRNGEDVERRSPGDDQRIVSTEFVLGRPAPDEFYYVRVHTRSGALAWSSPMWGDRK